VGITTPSILAAPPIPTKMLNLSIRPTAAWSLVLVASRLVAAVPGLAYGPAPAPADGPPLSAHASRNRDLLPAQICGIAGAYLLTVLFLGTALLTFGRRLRRAAQSSRGTLAMEMVKPANRALEISPISPASSKRSFWSPKKFTFRKPEKSGTSSTLASPGIESVTSFDKNVVEQDIQARQAEMERLYAAVMEHDAKKASSVNVNEQPPEEPQYQHQPQPAASRRPPHLVTNPAISRLSDTHHLSPASPHSPRSPIRAIYPPDSQIPEGPATPTSPVRAGQSQGPPPLSPTGKTTYPASARRSRTSSFGSSASKKSRGLRNIRISAPIPKAEGDEDDRAPLTPRHYDPGPPPTPPTATTPGTATTNAGTDYEYEGLDRPQPLPNPAPQRGGEYPYHSAQSTAPTQSLGSLPFRNMQSTAPHPSDQPLSPRTPALRTTFVTRHPTDPFSRNAPRTGGIGSAGLATPYSAYMPFTPVTPVVTPLVGRRERKERKREEGRRVVTREDEVKEEGELWDSAY
jgi:hypothetical protein